jgi:hypothetical protein
MTRALVSAPKSERSTGDNSATGPNAAGQERARAKALPLGGGMSKWRMLDALRPLARPRQRACRVRRISPTVQLQKMPGGNRKTSGVMSCGSVWACPVCSQRICSHRAEELKGCVKDWKGLVSMLTLTVRHALGDDLRGIRKGVAAAWRRLWQGRKAKQLRAMFHVKHHVRALEVTHGANGWHPHLHVLMWCTADADAGALDFLREQWIAAVEKELGASAAPDWTHGVVHTPGGAGGYLAKFGLEVTHVHTKSGRRSSRTPWEIALDAIDGDEASAALWRTYCRDMKGARQLTWSGGARRFFGLDARDSDAAIVERDDSPDGELIAEWDGASWDLCAKTDPFWVSRVASAEPWELEDLPGWLLAVRVERDGAGLPPAVPF